MLPGVPSKPRLISLLQSTPSTGHTFTNYFTLSFTSHSPFSLSLVTLLSLSGWHSPLSSLSHWLGLSSLSHCSLTHSLRAHSLTHSGSLTYSLGELTHSLTQSSLTYSHGGAHSLTQLTHLGAYSLTQSSLTHSLGEAHSLT